MNVPSPLAKLITYAPLLLAGLQTAVAGQDGNTLYSYRSDGPVMLDALAEAAWDKAVPLTLTLDHLPYKPDSYKGMTSTKVTIRSLYNDANIYFLVRYDDPSQDLDRYPWVKQGDGRWKQLSNKDETGHENTYYEDKFGMFWNINTRGFAKKGCDIACHMKDDKGLIAGIDQKSPGRKYT